MTLEEINWAINKDEWIEVARKIDLEILDKVIYGFSASCNGRRVDPRDVLIRNKTSSAIIK